MGKSWSPKKMTPVLNEVFLLLNSMSNSKYWIRKKNEYPNSLKLERGLLLRFSPTYFCGTAFSAMTVLDTKQRNRLQLCVCLRLAVTSVRPRIKMLTDTMQKQRSHWLNLQNSAVMKETKPNFFSNL
jgi:hypothetical protein